jgi:hypothetical protein
MADGSVSPDDLGILDPVPERVTLSSGLLLDVHPLTVRQLSPFVRALGPAREALADPAADVWDLIADYGEDITEALTVALAMPRTAIECLSPADYLDALNAMLRANRDFFGLWLFTPAMARAARTLEAAAGPTPSPTSSPPDTPPET